MSHDRSPVFRWAAAGLLLAACGGPEAGGGTVPPATMSPGTGTDVVVDLDDVFGADPNSQPIPPTPDGWVLIEWGRLRVSVPPELSPFDESNWCTVDGDEQGGDWLTVGCGAATLTVEDEQLRVVGLDAAGRDVIVGTVGVSSSYRFFNSTLDETDVPDDWQWISRHGFTFAVPPDWPIEEQPADLPDPDGCAAARLAPGPRVLIGRGTFGDGDCDRPILQEVDDGVRLFEYTDAERREFTEYYPGHQVFHHFLSEDVSHVLRIGFGADSLTGLTIVASVRSTDGPTNATD